MSISGLLPVDGNTRWGSTVNASVLEPSIYTALQRNRCKLNFHEAGWKVFNFNNFHGFGMQESRQTPLKWYAFQGTGKGVAISTCSGTQFDARLLVFRGSCNRTQTQDLCHPVCIGSLSKADKPMHSTEIAAKPKPEPENDASTSPMFHKIRKKVFVPTSNEAWDWLGCPIPSKVSRAQLQALQALRNTDSPSCQSGVFPQVLWTGSTLANHIYYIAVVGGF